MPVIVMMGPSEFKMLSAEPRDRVIQGTMDDYERALAEGLITPYQGRPLRFDQPAPAQSAQTAAAPAQPQAEWRGRPVPTPTAQTYSAPAAYQPAPSRGSAGMQIVGGAQPAQMKGRADYAALGEPVYQPSPYDTTVARPVQADTRYTPVDRSNWGRPYTPPVPASPPYLAMPQSVPEPVAQGWNAQNIPGLSDMTGPMRPVENINPLTFFPYQRADLPPANNVTTAVTQAQPRPAYPFMSLPQTMPEPLVQQWNAQNIPGLAEMTAPVAAAPDAMTRMYPQNSMQFTGGPEETGAMRRVMPVLEQPSNLYEAWRNPQPAGAYSSMTQAQAMPQYVAPGSMGPLVDEFGNVIVDPYSNRWR